MTLENLVYENNSWKKQIDKEDISNVDLVTVFGDTDTLENQEHYEYLKNRYPQANIIGCSTAGNILEDEITQSSIVATAVSFDKAHTVLKSIKFNDGDDIEALSFNLVKKFDTKGLKHIFILSDGLKLNGSDVVKGINRAIDIPKTGGLAGDGIRLEKTLVMANAPAAECVIAAVGFYGESLTIGSGSVGGWSEFGSPRVVTKSNGNTLYTLDDEPAVDYYRRYLNAYSDNLQDIALKFPFGIKKNETDIPLIRTAVIIDEDDKSIVLTGDILEGYTAQLMRPDVEILIKEAGKAAQIASVESNDKVALALTISCAGRRVILDQLVDDEVEEVAEALGENINLVGFYSYGEIAPFQEDIQTCKLHNQTMTITVIYED